MHSTTKWWLGATFSLALLCGFIHPLWPDGFISYKRLHIFLFNLCGGGALILYYTEGTRELSHKVRGYFLLSLGYAFCAALKWYVPALIMSLPLIFIVESVRIKRFSLFPLAFFRLTEAVNDKFNQAALICLSAGMVIASFVIINNEYLHLVSYEKLTIDIFFLGYSFPISLITMAVMFSFMKGSKGSWDSWLKEISFWLINLGVITFFIFIIFEILIAEITIAFILFFAVCIVFYLFLTTAANVQQKTFLISGISFLLCTGITGIFYLFRYFSSSFDEFYQFILLLHAMVSLYGWNLSGLFVIIRRNDFPIRLNSFFTITLHWIIVLILAPLGKYYFPFAIIALPAYMILLWTVLFGKGTKKEA